MQRWQGMADPAQRSRRVKELARREGFELVGVAPPDTSAHGDFLGKWLASGFHGEMEYLARPEAVARRRDPGLTLDRVRSVVVVGDEHFRPDPEGVPEDPSRGVIARYARGRDYHRVVMKKLRRLHRRVEELVGEPVAGRAYVDTGPLLERELGQRAGLGWFGRNTMLIHPRRGSHFFLGALLLELDLEPDPPFAEDHCGTCRSCLDACPTGALRGRDENGAPVMDARLCISYLTIEHRGPIPRELRSLMGNRVYGCDICQEVCPFNVKFAEETTEPGYAARGPGERPVGVEPEGGRSARNGGLPDEGGSAEPAGSGSGSGGATLEEMGPGSAEPGRTGPPHPGTDGPPLPDLLATALSEERWEAFSRGSAIRRAGRAGFARNVCVAMGNWLGGKERPEPAAVDLLVQALSDPEPLVRGHAAWALGRIRWEIGRSALEVRLPAEADAWVREEVESALRG